LVPHVHRSVQPKDKSLAVGLELTLVGLIAYVPARLLYQLMAGNICLSYINNATGLN